MKYKIEKNQPIPEGSKIPLGARSERIRVLMKMEIGDSLFFPADNPTEFYKMKDSYNFLQSRKDSTGVKFSYRSNEKGWRIWRVA